MAEQHAEADEKHETGHISSLNDEQKGHLKEIWRSFLKYSKDEQGAASHAAGKGMDRSANGESSRGAGDENVSSKEKAQKSAKSDEEKEAEAERQEQAALDELMHEHGPTEFNKAFWQFCMGEDPDALMLRFLRARGWDPKKAFAMLAATLKWRIETKVPEIIEAGEEGLCELPGVKKNLSLAKCYYHGTDMEGRPCIYARVKYHKASDQSQEEMLKYIVLQMETSRMLLPVRSNVETASVVFDMTGFGLSNMDWDTATMVIKIFESYYPETLGHAIIYNAPTVFSAVWKIVKGMLDPAVREKVHFASSASDMAKLIDPKHLEKDFGGSSSWRYRFKGPVAGENKAMEDKETKEKRLNAYKESCKTFEESTDKWINGDESVWKERRDKLVKILEVRQLDLDPYVRGKTTYSRDGTIIGDGTVVWHYDHGRSEEFGKSADEWAEAFGIEDPPKRPRNKEEDEIVLSSAEDTVSSTSDSEEDILEDKHHKHHNAVAVGFAKVGDSIGNTFSKITPGPSIHERKKMEKEARHKRHEERRARKLEAKRQRIEAEKRVQEEKEEERQQREEEEEREVEASYQGYLSRMTQLSLNAGNRVADYVPRYLGGNYLKAYTSPVEGEAKEQAQEA